LESLALLVTKVDERQLNGQTCNRVPATGTARFFAVENHVATCDVGYVTWANGERDVRCLRVDGPQSVRRLERGLRLEVKARSKRDFVELRLARLTGGAQWSNLYKGDS
jgi:hypothetical protein